MALYNKEEAKKLMERVLSYATADETEINLSGNIDGNIRYARNSVSTSGEVINVNLAVSSSYGKRTGIATIDELDEASLKKVVARAEELAKLAPENDERMPLLGPQTFAETKEWFESSANINPDYRASVAEASIKAAEEEKLVAAGFFNNTNFFNAVLNSKGMFAYHRGTNATFNLTVRDEAGTTSGYANDVQNDISKFDAKATSMRAVKKAAANRNAVALEPGKYTVVLEPLAAAELIQRMFFAMNQRTADEGRSFMTKTGGGTRVGEKLFDERVTMYSDPQHPELPTQAWDGEGQALSKTMWIEKGVVKNLAVSRYWAEKTGKAPLPFGANMIMEGGTESLEDLIKGTQRGILVTRFWYIRQVDPKTELYTGLTRDGTFYIENGKIKHPVKNFRYNESPVIMLNNVDALGKPVRVLAEETGSTVLVPPMRIRDFTFSSLSDAV